MYFVVLSFVCLLSSLTGMNIVIPHRRRSTIERSFIHVSIPNHLLDCHQGYLFNFDWIFLKVADKVDIDEISDKLENWSHRIINHRVTSLDFRKKPLFDFVVSRTFSFNQIFLKVADKVNMDEIPDKFENCLDRIINLTVTFPQMLKKPLLDLYQHLI